MLVFASVRSATSLAVSGGVLASMLETKSARWLGRDSLVQRAIDHRLAAADAAVVDSGRLA